jgi:hypothetical protein
MLRLYPERRGGHTHVRVFAGTEAAAKGKSLGKCGDLVFRNEEWAAFQAVLARVPGAVIDGPEPLVAIVEVPLPSP